MLLPYHFYIDFLYRRHILVNNDNDNDNVVRGMRGVGGVCEMCMCLARDGVGGGEWMRALGLGFINPVGSGEVLGVCLVWVAVVWVV